MKIGHPTDKTPPPPPAAAGAAAAPNGAAAAQHPASASATAIPAKADDSAKIQLSKTASTLLEGGSSADFDAEKVARISKSIEDGSFKIDPAKIADKLISNAQELLTRTQR